MQIATVKKALKMLGYFMAGAAVVVTIIKILKETFSIGFRTALIVTIFVLCVYALFWVLATLRKLSWTSKEGHTGFVKKPGIEIHLGVLGILTAVWWPVIYHSVFLVAGVSNKPVFDTSSKYFKILILPFQKICSYQGKRYDIGFVLNKRLEQLNQQDSLEIKTWYLNDSFDLSNFSSEQADSIMKFHHADQIIYGYYAFEECGSTEGDLVCFNYRTDISKRKFSDTSLWKITDGQSAGLRMVSFQGINDIAAGAGTEDIEYVIHLVTAISAQQKNQYEKAISYYRQIKPFEKYEKPLIQIGYCFYNLKLLDSARNAYRKAITVNPRNENSWNDLGTVYFVQKDYNNAMQCFRKAIALNPGFVSSWIGMGGSYNAVNNFDSALFYLRYTIQIEPHNIEALNHAGFVHQSAGNFDSALVYFRKATSINPRFEFAWNNIGFAYQHKGNLDSAIYFYRKAVSINSGYVDAYNNLAYIYQQKQVFDSAIKFYRIAITLNPEAESPNINMGITYFQLNKLDSSLNYFRKVSQINPGAWDVQYDMGKVYQKSGDIKNEIDCFNKAIAINPLMEIVWVNLGAAYNRAYRFGDAIVASNKAISINSKNPESWNNLAYAYRNLKNYNKAKDAVRQAIQLNSKNEFYWASLGLVERFLKNYAVAETCYKKALAINPNSDIALYRIAMLYSVENKKVLCLKALQQSIALNARFKVQARSEPDFKKYWNDNGFMTLTK